MSGAVLAGVVMLAFTCDNKCPMADGTNRMNRAAPTRLL